jgi:hypothetical protein
MVLKGWNINTYIYMKGKRVFGDPGSNFFWGWRGWRGWWVGSQASLTF